MVSILIPFYNADITGLSLKAATIKGIGSLFKWESEGRRNDQMSTMRQR